MADSSKHGIGVQNPVNVNNVNKATPPRNKKTLTVNIQEPNGNGVSKDIEAGKPFDNMSINNNSACEDRRVSNTSLSSVTETKRCDTVLLLNKQGGLLSTKEPGAEKICSKPKKKQNVKIKVAVAIFFIIIIVGCAVVWHFYHKSLLEIDIGRIRFIQKSRLLLVENSDGFPVLSGKLGVGIPQNLLPFDCAGEGNKLKYICLKYKGYATLRIQYNASDDTRCYNINWENHADDLNPTDCLSMSKSTWYGGGTGHMQPIWPINKQHFTDTPHISGGTFGSVLERYWLSSDGVSINIDTEIPLYVSMNRYNAEHNMCFTSKYGNGIYYKNSSNLHPKLNYTICVSENIRTMHSYASAKHLKAPATTPSLHYIGKPIWAPRATGNLTISQKYMENFVENIVREKLDGGLFVLAGDWEKNIGDLTLDKKKFTSIEKLIFKLQEYFTVAIELHPYVSIESAIFKEAAYSNYLTTDMRNSGPALTEWRRKYVGVIDLTNSVASEWYVDRVRNLMKYYNISMVSLIGGQSDSLPRFQIISAASDHTTPDIFGQKYNTLLHEQLPNVVYSDVASGSQVYPITVRLSEFKPDWQKGGLQSVLPAVLTASLLGYRNIHPGTIGGFGTDVVAEEELYIRWMQLSAFLPYMEFSVPPWYYSGTAVNITRDFVYLHRTRIVPTLKVFLSAAYKTGAPVFRPLWWLNPNDRETFDINDEFLIGTKYLVAPILYKGKRSRDIYLPHGVWLDPSTSETLVGGRWIYNYPVPLENVPYFTYIDGLQGSFY